MKEFISLKDKHQVSGANVVTAAGRSVVVERLSIPAKPGAATQDVGPISSALPVGTEGDILYHNGSAWIVLDNPGAPTINNWVLRHNGTGPYWDEPVSCP